MPSKSSFTDFLACVKILHYEGDILSSKFISDNGLDPLKYGQSFLLHQVTEQLIKMQKTTLWVKELKKLALNDPSVLFYLVEVFIAHDKLKDALTLLAKTLLEHPLMV